MPHRLPALSLAFAAALLSVIGSCGRGSLAAVHPDANLTLTGSSTIAPLVAEIGQRFELLHPGVRIDVQTGGSSKGLRDVQEGLADIAMMSRPLKGAEVGLVQAHVIARDGIALIVHASNPLVELSADQVRAIYRGHVSNWGELGGFDGEITVVNKASGRATLDVFLDHFDLLEEEIQADLIIGDNQQGLKVIAGSPLAIGYVSVGTAEVEIQAGATLRMLPFAGVAASVDSVARGSYSISRPLNLVTLAEPEGLAREFIDFCLSTEVHDLMADLRFSPTQSLQGSANQAMVETSAGMAR